MRLRTVAVAVAMMPLDTETSSSSGTSSPWSSLRRIAYSGAESVDPGIGEFRVERPVVDLAFSTITLMENVWAH